MKNQEMFENPESLRSILAINVGSSSIKFSLHENTELLKLQFRGKVDRIGLSGTTMTIEDSTKNHLIDRVLIASDYNSIFKELIQWIDEHIGIHSLQAVGHRVVHGVEHTTPMPITQGLLEELHVAELYDPEHMPNEVKLIETFQQRYPELQQFACFDTAFHRNMPRVAKLLAIPRRFDVKGIHRYGFHGLSFAYLMDVLAELSDKAVTKGRVILAHLGNGASLAAILNGHSIDTSMGFTPTAGLPMGTRSGDLDPGLFLYLEQKEKMDATEFQHMTNYESGLLGVSEISSDMRDLLEVEETDIRAAEAVALFCYQTKKWIGAFAAALGGLNTLVFTGGIGENAPDIRTRVCQGLGFLGIELDELLNRQGEPVISSAKSRVLVRMIPTNEELMIVRSVQEYASATKK